MTEDYLHYIWKYKLFNQSNLRTTENEPLEIIHFGFHNHDSGPDFSQGKVKIGNTTWAGNIEIHINSSDWLNHNHQKDRAYDSVVLHVVYHHDKEITTTKGSVIPTLEMNDRLDYAKFENYQEFVFTNIPCSNSLSQVPEIIISSAKEQMLIERLAEKSELINQDLKQYQHNWEQVFFQYLAKSMGMKINSHPMEQLIKNTEVTLFSKLGNNLLSIESILFGQAGFLVENRKEEYYIELQKEYLFQQTKNNLIPINKVFWKFSKLRPSNFPTIRIAQLARLLLSNQQLFDRLIVLENNYEDLKQLLSIAISEGFWHNHYTFDKESKPAKKSIGITLINSIVINTIAPFLYCFGRYKADERYIERAINLLEELPAEDNKVTRVFEHKMAIDSSADSQGVIQCHNNYCIPKKCLDCSIGVYLMKK